METDLKQRKPPRTRRNFTDEYKAGAVALVLKEGKSVTRVAKDLDLPDHVKMSHKWQILTADCAKGILITV